MTLGRALQQARALAQSRIAYLSIEVNSRVLFVAVTREVRARASRSAAARVERAAALCSRTPSAYIEMPVLLRPLVTLRPYPPPPTVCTPRP